MGWRMMRGEDGRWNSCCFMGDVKAASDGGASEMMRPLEGGRGSKFSDEAILALTKSGEFMYKVAGQYLQRRHPFVL